MIVTVGSKTQWRICICYKLVLQKGRTNTENHTQYFTEADLCF